MIGGDDDDNIIDGCNCGGKRGSVTEGKENEMVG